MSPLQDDQCPSQNVCEYNCVKAKDDSHNMGERGTKVPGTLLTGTVPGCPVPITWKTNLLRMSLGKNLALKDDLCIYTGNANAYR